MQGILIFALLAFAAAGVIHGLRIRRASFLAGLSLSFSDADRSTAGWISSFLLQHPLFCRGMDMLSKLLPGPGSELEGAVTGSTTFTYLQSRTILHRYYKWQVHNILRILAGLLFCGMVAATAMAGYSTTGYTIVAVGSGLLCVYALLSWRRIRSDTSNTKSFCRGEAEEHNEVLGAFVDLSQGAMRQAVAFAMVFACNFGFQVLVLVDADDLLVLDREAARIESFEEDPTAFAS